jgi:predicted  nucleic acid-binding Zn-ribbon protein
MNEKGDAARKARKLRASRDRWKQRSAEKQHQVRQLRGTVRDLSVSREHWKARVKELEHQLQVLQAEQDSQGAGGPAGSLVFGGERLKHLMRATLLIPLCFPGD